MAELKQDLGLIYLRKNKSGRNRAGIYLCPQCGDDIVRAHWQNKQKPNQVCKQCSISNTITTHGLTGTVLFKRWTGMMNRCYNKNASDYLRYGDKGVIVCRKWRNDFQSYYDWAISNGFEASLTIDKDMLCDKLHVHPKVYSPKTCQWITSEENIRYAQVNKIRKSVIQFSIEDHKLINTYKSCLEAHKLSGVIETNINRAARGLRESAGGFIWIYEEEYLNGVRPSYNGRVYKTKQVIQIDKITNKVIAIFESSAMAAEHLGKSSSSIAQICNGHILPSGNTRQSAHGFKWKYKDSTL